MMMGGRLSACTVCVWRFTVGIELGGGASCGAVGLQQLGHHQVGAALLAGQHVALAAHHADHHHHTHSSWSARTTTRGHHLAAAAYRSTRKTGFMVSSSGKCTECGAT